MLGTRAQIEETAKLKLQELYTENLGVVDDATARTAIVAELQSKGYDVKNTTTSSATVKGIAIKDASGNNIEEINLGTGATATIRIELQTEDAGATKTYVKIQEKYYEMTITGLNVSISTEEQKEVTDGDDGYHLKLTPPTSGIEMTVGEEKITGETEIVSGAQITIKGGNEKGTYTFNVKEEKTSLTKNVNVTVAPLAAGTAVENPESYGTNPNAQATADGAGKIFALPTGASYDKTTTVDTGVVVTIKESEFVWVPVDDVVLDTSKVANLPTSSSNGISNEKTYTPMAVKVGDNYKGILYSYSGSNGYVMYNKPSNNYQGGSTDYREPDVVSYDTGDYSAKGITLDKLTTEYNAMIASVLKYKGFYVARYEAGIQDGKVVFKNAKTTSGVTTLSASSSSGNMWYGLYEKIASFAETNDKYVSSMIWGSQYDAMMNWMAKNGKEVGTVDSSKANKDSNKVTGSSTDDVINNVYDLYGCHYEWTLEADSTFYRVLRGGFFNFSNSPASRDYSTPFYTNDNSSSRATLYIK